MPAQQSELDQQKAALVAAIAQQGSQGQVAFSAEAARRAQAQQQATAQLAGLGQMTGSAGSAPAAYMKQLQGAQNDNYGVYAQDAAMSQQSFQNSIANTAASNAAYMDQARAAVPIVNAQTAGTVARVRAEQEAERAQRQAELEMMQFEKEQAALEAQLAEEERQLRREEIAFEREQMANEGDEEATAKRQQGILVRAKNLGLVGGEVASLITNDAPDFRTAIIGMNTYADSVIAGLDPRDAAAGEAEWEKKKGELVRMLYKFYEGKDAPKDVQQFGEVFRDNNLNPATRLPGYTSVSERAQIKKSATKGAGYTVPLTAAGVAAARKAAAKAKKRPAPLNYYPWYPGADQTRPAGG